MGLRTLLLAMLCAGLLMRAASADVDIELGIYAYDGPTEVVWSCYEVVDAMAQRMADILEEPVSIEVSFEKDFGAGTAAFIAGRVDIARFAGVERLWVIRPTTPARVQHAWRDALVAFQLEDIIGSWHKEMTRAMVGAVERLPGRELLARQFASCDVADELLASAADLARGPAPSLNVESELSGLLDIWRRDTLANINALPATAAGPSPRPARGSATTSPPYIEGSIQSPPRRPDTGAPR